MSVRDTPFETGSRYGKCPVLAGRDVKDVRDKQDPKDSLCLRNPDLLPSSRLKCTQINSCAYLAERPAKIGLRLVCGQQTAAEP